MMTGRKADEVAINRIETAPGIAVRQQRAETVLVRGSRVEQPTTVDELVEAVGRAAREGATIRPAGAGTALTGLAEGPAVTIDVRRLTGLVDIDGEARTATFRAGTTVDEAIRALARYRAALVGAPALGDATLAGALAVGAHGFAPREGTFSANVAGVALVTPNGALTRVSASRNAELWPAVRCSLGALDVVAEVTVRIRPIAELRTSRKRRDIDALVDDLAEARAKTDHYRVDWRPATDEATLTVGWREAPGTRAVHRTAAAELPAAESAAPARPRRRDRVRRGLARALPFLAPLLERDADRPAAAGADDRAVRLTDGTETSGDAPFVEYQFAQADARLAVAVLRELADRDRRLAAADARLTLVAADDVWLSPSYGRDTVALMVRVPAVDRAALDVVDDAFLRAGGLPSWGGLHTITAAEAAYVMPRFGDFAGARHALDPHDRMHNATLRRVLG